MKGDWYLLTTNGANDPVLRGSGWEAVESACFFVPADYNQGNLLSHSF